MKRTRLTRAELEAACEALAARTAGEIDVAEECQPLEIYESAHEKLSEMLTRKENRAKH